MSVELSSSAKEGSTLNFDISMCTLFTTIAMELQKISDYLFYHIHRIYEYALVCADGLDIFASINSSILKWSNILLTVVDTVGYDIVFFSFLGLLSSGSFRGLFESVPLIERGVDETYKSISEMKSVCNATSDDFFNFLKRGVNRIYLAIKSVCCDIPCIFISKKKRDIYEVFFITRVRILKYINELNESNLTIDEYPIAVGQLIRNLEDIVREYYSDVSTDDLADLSHLYTAENISKVNNGRSDPLKEVVTMLHIFIQYTHLIFEPVEDINEKYELVSQGLRSLIEALKFFSKRGFEKAEVDLSSTYFVAYNNIPLDHFTALNSLKSQLIKILMNYKASVPEADDSYFAFVSVRNSIAKALSNFEFNPRDFIDRDEVEDFNLIVHPLTKLYHNLYVSPQEVANFDINICTDTNGRCFVERVTKEECLKRMGRIYDFCTIIDVVIARIQRANMDLMDELFFNGLMHGTHVVQLHTANLISYINRLDLDVSIFRSSIPITIDISRKDIHTKVKKEINFIVKPFIIPEGSYDYNKFNDDIYDNNAQVKLGNRNDPGDASNNSTGFKKVIGEFILMGDEFKLKIKDNSKPIEIIKSASIKDLCSLYENNKLSPPLIELNSSSVNISRPTVYVSRLYFKLLDMKHEKDSAKRGFRLVISSLNRLSCELSLILKAHGRSFDLLDKNMIREAIVSLPVFNAIGDDINVCIVNYLGNLIKDTIFALQDISSSNDELVGIICNSERAVERLYIRVKYFNHSLFLENFIDIDDGDDDKIPSTTEVGTSTFHRIVHNEIRNKYYNEDASISNNLRSEEDTPDCFDKNLKLDGDETTKGMVSDTLKTTEQGYTSLTESSLPPSKRLATEPSLNSSPPIPECTIMEGDNKVDEKQCKNDNQGVTIFTAKFLIEEEIITDVLECVAILFLRAEREAVKLTGDSYEIPEEAFKALIMYEDMQVLELDEEEIEKPIEIDLVKGDPPSSFEEYVETVTNKSSGIPRDTCPADGTSSGLDYIHAPQDEMASSISGSPLDFVDNFYTPASPSDSISSDFPDDLTMINDLIHMIECKGSNYDQGFCNFLEITRDIIREMEGRKASIHGDEVEGVVFEGEVLNDSNLIQEEGAEVVQVTLSRESTETDISPKEIQTLLEEEKVIENSGEGIVGAVAVNQEEHFCLREDLILNETEDYDHEYLNVVRDGICALEERLEAFGDKMKVLLESDTFKHSDESEKTIYEDINLPSGEDRVDTDVCITTSLDDLDVSKRRMLLPNPSSISEESLASVSTCDITTRGSITDGPENISTRRIILSEELSALMSNQLEESGGMILSPSQWLEFSARVNTVPTPSIFNIIAQITCIDGTVSYTLAYWMELPMLCNASIIGFLFGPSLISKLKPALINGAPFFILDTGETPREDGDANRIQLAHNAVINGSIAATHDGNDSDDRSEEYMHLPVGISSNENPNTSQNSESGPQMDVDNLGTTTENITESESHGSVELKSGIKEILHKWDFSELGSQWNTWGTSRVISRISRSEVKREPARRHGVKFQDTAERVIFDLSLENASHFRVADLCSNESTLSIFRYFEQSLSCIDRIHEAGEVVWESNGVDKCRFIDYVTRDGYVILLAIEFNEDDDRKFLVSNVIGEWKELCNNKMSTLWYLLELSTKQIDLNYLDEVHDHLIDPQSLVFFNDESGELILGESSRDLKPEFGATDVEFTEDYGDHTTYVRFKPSCGNITNLVDDKGMMIWKAKDGEYSPSTDYLTKGGNILLVHVLVVEINTNLPKHLYFGFFQDKLEEISEERFDKLWTQLENGYINDISHEDTSVLKTSKSLTESTTEGFNVSFNTFPTDSNKRTSNQLGDISILPTVSPLSLPDDPKDRLCTNEDTVLSIESDPDDVKGGSETLDGINVASVIPGPFPISFGGAEVRSIEQLDDEPEKVFSLDDLIYPHKTLELNQEVPADDDIQIVREENMAKEIAPSVNGLIERDEVLSAQRVAPQHSTVTVSLQEDKGELPMRRDDKSTHEELHFDEADLCSKIPSGFSNISAYYTFPSHPPQAKKSVTANVHSPSEEHESPRVSTRKSQCASSASYSRNHRVSSASGVRELVLITSTESYENLTLDLNLKEDTDDILVVVHPSLVTVCYQFIPKHGNISRIVQGDEVIWDEKGQNVCTEAVTYITNAGKILVLKLADISRNNYFYRYWDGVKWRKMHATRLHEYLYKLRAGINVDNDALSCTNEEYYRLKSDETPQDCSCRLLIGYVTSCGFPLTGNVAVLKVKYKGYRNCTQLVSINGDFDRELVVNVINEELEKVYLNKSYVPDRIEESRLRIPGRKVNYGHYYSPNNMGFPNSRWIAIYLFEDRDLSMTNLKSRIRKSHKQLSMAEVLSGFEDAHEDIKKYVMEELLLPLDLSINPNVIPECLARSDFKSEPSLTHYITSLCLPFLNNLSSGSSIFKGSNNRLDEIGYSFWLRKSIDYYIYYLNAKNGDCLENIRKCLMKDGDGQRFTFLQKSLVANCRIIHNLLVTGSFILVDKNNKKVLNAPITKSNLNLEKPALCDQPCNKKVERKFIHPRDLENPSSFLKMYGDPLCDLAKTSKTSIEIGIDGNWECHRCNNVNFPRRIYCNQCSTKRDELGDAVVLKYAIQLYRLYTESNTAIPSDTAYKYGTKKGSPAEKCVQCPVGAPSHCMEPTSQISAVGKRRRSRVRGSLPTERSAHRSNRGYARGKAKFNKKGKGRSDPHNEGYHFTGHQISPSELPGNCCRDESLTHYSIPKSTGELKGEAKGIDDVESITSEQDRLAFALATPRSLDRDQAVFVPTSGSIRNVRLIANVIRDGVTESVVDNKLSTCTEESPYIAHISSSKVNSKFKHKNIAFKV